VIRSRTEYISVKTLQFGFTLNGFNIKKLGFITGKADSFSNKFGNLLSLTGSSGEYNEYFGHDLSPASLNSTVSSHKRIGNRFSVLLLGPTDAIVGALGDAIRCVAGIIKKFTFLLTGWALIRMSIFFKGIAAI
jgi:hypothetical protein